MAHVVMRAPFGKAHDHRQYGLRSIQCLNLTFLIDAQHHGIDRRAHVQANDVAYLVHEQRIDGQLEGILTVWLQTKDAPDARDGYLMRSRSAGVETPVPFAAARVGNARRNALRTATMFFMMPISSNTLPRTGWFAPHLRAHH
jgi:hypothetical protein